MHMIREGSLPAKMFTACATDEIARFRPEIITTYWPLAIEALLKRVRHSRNSGNPAFKVTGFHTDSGLVRRVFFLRKRHQVTDTFMRAPAEILALQCSADRQHEHVSLVAQVRREPDEWQNDRDIGIATGMRVFSAKLKRSGIGIRDIRS